MTKKTELSEKEYEKLHQELFNLLLKKLGATKKDVYDEAERRLINRHLDMLTPSEIARFRQVLSL